MGASSAKIAYDAQKTETERVAAQYNEIRTTRAFHKARQEQWLSLLNETAAQWDQWEAEVWPGIKASKSAEESKKIWSELRSKWINAVAQIKANFEVEEENFKRVDAMVGKAWIILQGDVKKLTTYEERLEREGKWSWGCGGQRRCCGGRDGYTYFS